MLTDKFCPNRDSAKVSRGGAVGEYPSPPFVFGATYDDGGRFQAFEEALLLS